MKTEEGETDYTSGCKLRRGFGPEKKHTTQAGDQIIVTNRAVERAVVCYFTKMMSPVRMSLFKSKTSSQYNA